MNLPVRTILFAATAAMLIKGDPKICFREPLINNNSEETLLEDITPKRGINSPFADEKSSENDNKEETKAVISQSKSRVSQSWYCKHTTNGERPTIPSEMSYIKDYNGYFLGGDEKVIYLTFDAGYENGNIEKILNTLKEENVPAAFFILDNLVKQNTGLVKRMEAEGHTVCNHTAKHKDMTTVTSFDDFKAELEAMENYYKEMTGYDLTKYYRPPEGKLSEQSISWACDLGYKTIMWSYAYADWDNNNQMSAEKATEKVC